MFARNKGIFLVGAGLAALWAALYFVVLVQPGWSQRESAISSAQSDLDTWLKNYKTGKDTMPLPDAAKKLAKQEEVLDAAGRTLKQTEFIADFAPFTLASAAGNDPNNYFDKKRNDVRSEVRDKMALKLAAGWEDLGFRGKVLEEPVQLNLARLLAFQRFCIAGKAAGIADIISITYPKHRIIPFSADDNVKVSKLYMLPIEVRFRATERKVPLMFYELQRPSDPGRSYFSLRGFQVAVKDKESGLLDCWVAVGAILTEKQAKDLKIEINEEERPGQPVKPPVNLDRY